MVRSLPLDSQTRPELPRILAIAAAIALHAFAFLLLLIPMATARLDVSVVEQEAPNHWIPPKIVPPTPLPPEQVPVLPPQQRAPLPQVLPRTDTSAVAPVIVDHGSLAREPMVPAHAAGADIAPGDPAPLQGVQLEYAFAPPPRYPGVAARSGAEGTVLLKILVGTDGRPIEVSVQQSSGNRFLDREARAHVLKTWRFKPAMRNGQAVQAYGLVPIDFSMQ